MSPLLCCWVLDTVCVDRGSLFIRVCGLEGHPHLHWNQQQCWVVLCVLVLTDSPPCPQSSDAQKYRALRDPSWVLENRASLIISGLQPEDEAGHY